jgi:hypothetical protein
MRVQQQAYSRVPRHGVGPVRRANLAALERIAEDDSDQRQTVVNVLCAYLRMAYSIPDDSVLNTLENQHAEAETEAEAEQAGTMVRCRRAAN